MALKGSVAKIFKLINMMHTQKSYQGKTCRRCAPFANKRFYCSYSICHIDELKNFCNTTILRGLTSNSLTFKQILSPNYCAQLGKPQDLLDIIDDYRNLRNQIHMPGDIVETPHLSKYSGDSLMKILVTFINEEIVGYNNAIVAKGELHSSYNLEPLLYFS